MIQVHFSRFAEKQVEKLPDHILSSLYQWVASLENIGLQETRKRKSYHDEPLKGNRLGQRSVRLNRSYRAIYTEFKDELKILVIEVNKHEY